MLDFLQNNWGNIVALAVVALVVAVVIVKMVSDKKAGVCACGQKCGNCNLCHNKKN